MSSNRIMVPMETIIKDISMGPFGSDIKVECFQDAGVPVLNGSNLTSVKMNGKEFRYVSKEKADSLKKALAHPGDIVITHRGTLGQLSYVPDDLPFDEFLISQSQFRVTLDTTKVNPVYFAYYFHTTEGQKRLLSFANYVGVPALALATTNFRELEFPLIDIALQNKIAAFLSLLDEKIENNNAYIATLDSMAKEIYEYWFVQFDFPDSTGKPYRQNGGKMVWNDVLKREIPKDWGITDIGHITINHDSERIPVSNIEREQMVGDIPYYGATGIMGYVNKAIFHGDFVLLAEDGSVMDEKGHPIIQRISGDVWVNNHAHVLEPVLNYSCKLLMLILGEISVTRIKTGSVQMKINKDNLNAWKIVDIPLNIRKRFINVVNNIDQQIIVKNRENQELIALRDFLLPMLMNGQISIK